MKTLILSVLSSLILSPAAFADGQVALEVEKPCIYTNDDDLIQAERLLQQSSRILYRRIQEQKSLIKTIESDRTKLNLINYTNLGLNRIGVSDSDATEKLRNDLDTTLLPYFLTEAELVKENKLLKPAQILSDVQIELNARTALDKAREAGFESFQATHSSQSSDGRHLREADKNNLVSLLVNQKRLAILEKQSARVDKLIHALRRKCFVVDLTTNIISKELKKFEQKSLDTNQR